MMSQSELSKMQYDGSAPTIAMQQLPRSGFVQILAEPQVWTTEVMRMRAPKCLRSAEKLAVNIP